MANNETYKCDEWFLIIQEYDKLNEKHITELEINNVLKDELRVKFYAFIKHDEDVNEDGIKETVHYHLVLKLKTTYAKSTVIGFLVRGLMVNPDIISVRPMKTFVGAVQYLIHKNDKDKYQYDLLNIWSNDIDEVIQIINESISSYEVDIYYLYNLCKNCDSLASVYKVLGIDKAKRYRCLVLDMWKEEHLAW